MSIVELWRKIQQCHLVTLREVFTTKAFGDHSMIFVYDYFPGAETLMTKHLSSTTSHTDPFSSDPSVPRPYSMQKNRMLQQQAGKGNVPLLLCLDQAIKTNFIYRRHDSGVFALELYHRALLRFEECSF